MSPLSRPLRIGARGSDLARWQAGRVQALLQARGIASELVTIRTAGDEGSQRPPAPASTGKGLFTKEIEEALLSGRIDLAVHSLKDLSVELPAGLQVVAYPEREDPRDALVSAAGLALEGLPRGARVGTSSLRRRAALLAARPDCQVVPVRGNVPTRLRKVGPGGLDAALLALAGLRRLGLATGAVPLDLEQFPPAPGQGALAVEARADDGAVLAALEPLDNPAIRAAVEAERAALAALEGGCQAAIGAFCRPEAGGLVLHVKVFAPDGARVLAASGPVDPAAPRASGRAVAEQLLRAGAGELIRAAAFWSAGPELERTEPT